MVDNLMDLTHLGYVHGSTIGGNPEQHNDAELTTTKKENGAHFLRWMLDSVPPPSFKNVGGFTTNIDQMVRLRVYRALLRSSVGHFFLSATMRKNRLRAARSRCASSTMQRLKARTNTTISSLLVSTDWMRTR